MTVDELIASICQQRGISGARDLEAAQNGINRTISRLGAIGRTFDAWYRCGSLPLNRLYDLAADLVVESLALAVNLLGAENVARLLEERGRK